MGIGDIVFVGSALVLVACLLLLAGKFAHSSKQKFVLRIPIRQPEKARLFSEESKRLHSLEAWFEENGLSGEKARGRNTIPDWEKTLSEIETYVYLQFKGSYGNYEPVVSIDEFLSERSESRDKIHLLRYDLYVALWGENVRVKEQLENTPPEVMGDWDGRSREKLLQLTDGGIAGLGDLRNRINQLAPDLIQAITLLMRDKRKGDKAIMEARVLIEKVLEKVEPNETKRKALLFDAMNAAEQKKTDPSVV